MPHGSSASLASKQSFPVPGGQPVCATIEKTGARGNAEMGKQEARGGDLVGKFATRTYTIMAMANVSGTLWRLSLWL